jgi:hypothetical protein
MPTPEYAVMPSVTVADIQPIATVVVAIIGLVTTLAAGAYAQSREAKSERTRWLRDRRTDVYLAVTSAFHQGQIYADDQRETLREIASVREEQSEVRNRLVARKTEVASTGGNNASLGPAELGQFKEQTAKFETRLARLENQSAEQAIRLTEHVNQLQDLSPPSRSWAAPGSKPSPPKSRRS